MNAVEAIKNSLAVSDMIWQSYVDDLSDEDFFKRPAENVNHIAWQLGHLIASEHQIIDGVCPGAMPELPEGFARKHSTETAGTDDSAAFLTKSQYVQLAQQQRQATLDALAGLSETDLDKPGPEGMEQIAPTVGATFSMQAAHYLMHAGQWVVLRRTLGKPPLF
ncbi:MAG: hypothetical protein CMJ48_09620 [Planctomycetaceae bacterium]|nr:hypothetical protein [Planctomycetaceae bacterium]